MADLEPSLLTNSQTFYSPTVSPGAVTLTPDLFGNSQAFYSATVLATYALLPSRVDDADSFHAPAVTATYTILPLVFSYGPTFYSPSLTVVGDWALQSQGSATWTNLHEDDLYVLQGYWVDGYTVRSWEQVSAPSGSWALI